MYVARSNLTAGGGALKLQGREGTRGDEKKKYAMPKRAMHVLGFVQKLSDNNFQPSLPKKKKKKKCTLSRQ